jgi:hypothetical protein
MIAELEWGSRADFIALGFTVLGWLFTGGWALWEKKQRGKAEQEIEDRDRRAKGPDLRPTDLIVNGTYIRSGQRVPENTPERTNIILQLVNRGARVSRVSANMTEPEGIVCRDGIIGENGAPNRFEPDSAQIHYLYAPKRFGKTQRITIRYEDQDGAKRCHVYKMIHGEVSFDRDNPS